jgi:hypothetical protein
MSVSGKVLGMTTAAAGVSYKDLDSHGHYSVHEVEQTLATQYGVPALMNRVQYVHFAKQVGLHRVLHNRPDELIDRAKFAREVTRHLNWSMLKAEERPEQGGEETTESGRFWK